MIVRNLMKCLQLPALLCLAFPAVALAQTTPPTTPAAAPAQEDLINPDRPGIADGSNVIGPRHFQIEMGIQYENHDTTTGVDRFLFVPTLLRFGVSSRFEFRIETNSAYSHEYFGGESSVGYSPVSIGAKYHFLDGDGQKKPSVGVIARVFPPSGSANFGSNVTQGDVRLAVDQDIAPKSLWSINPNIGFGIYDAGNGNTFVAGLFAATLNYNPTSHLNFFVDTGVQSPDEYAGKTSTIVDAGVAIILGSNVQLDLSSGTRVSGETGPRPFIGAGVSVRF
jgi:hypothetical protein